MRKTIFIVTALAMAAAPALAQDSGDEAAIRGAALDYIEGWYEGDAARMERAVHPDLVKRIVVMAPQGVSALNTMNSYELVASTGRGGGSDTAPEDQHKDVTILDVYGDAASVRIYASGWVDYLHLARWNGEWKIVNVLWELHPQE